MKKNNQANALKISKLGFGAWPLGNTSKGKTMSEEEGIELVQAAYEKGITVFDTAPNYAYGRSETILGKALKAFRENVYINTKFGHHPDGTLDFDEEKIYESVNGSLNRLQTSYLDSVILHNPPNEVLEGKTKHFTYLNDLKSKAIVHRIGVSIDTLDELNKTLKHLDVDVIELYFNVFAQSTRHMLKEVQANHIMLIIKVPLDSGWLSGKYHSTMTFDDIRLRWSETDKKRRHDLVKKLKTMVDDDYLVPYALGFIWSYEAVNTVIPGIRNKEQLNEHLKASEFSLNKSLKTKLENFYDQHLANTPLPW